jgi:hypothetical protein
VGLLRRLSSGGPSREEETPPGNGDLYQREGEENRDF